MKAIVVSLAPMDLGVREAKCCLSNVAYTMNFSRFPLSFFGDSKDGEGRMNIRIGAMDQVIDDLMAFFRGIRFDENGDIHIVDKNLSEMDVKDYLIAIAICISGHTHPLSFPINTEGVTKINGESSVIEKMRKLIENIAFLEGKQTITTKPILQEV